MNLNDKPNLKALRRLLEEVGQLNLYYKIVQSENREALKANVSYAIKSLGSKIPDRDYDEILRDARRTAQDVNQEDIKHQILSLLDALQKTDSIIEQMTKAHMNKKNSIPAKRFFESRSKSNAKRYHNNKFDFNKLTRRALRRVK
jgi:glutamyl-tRNA reductase